MLLEAGSFCIHYKTFYTCTPQHYKMRIIIQQSQWGTHLKQIGFYNMIIFIEANLFFVLRRMFSVVRSCDEESHCVYRFQP